MARASYLQVWQYITAIILIVVLGFHLIERVPGLSPLTPETYEESLTYEAVRKAYTEYGWVLAILLVAALFHGLNGVRGILLEWRQTRGWTLAVNAIVWLVFIGLSVFGLYTIYYHYAVTGG